MASATMPGFTHQEQWDAQLYTHYHHKHILLQGLVVGNVFIQLNFIQEHILAPALFVWIFYSQ